jgi:Uncharacterised nucleotidyltransferase
MTQQIVVRQNNNCFPNSDQILLLKAALLSGEAARDAWQEWSKSVNIDQLNLGEVRLLPLLYHNLRRNGIPNSQIPGVFKDSYFRTWAENNLLFHQATQLLYKFQDAKIPTLVLKGAAIASQYYQNYGLRPMSDFDFLVPTDRAEESNEILKQNDWQPKVVPGCYYPKKITKNYTCLHHSWDFVNSSQKNIDMHWHVLHNSLALEADLDFWAGARSIEISGIKTLMLDPADQLLHVCIHGARWNPVTPIRWVTDAIIIIQRHPNLDWDRLIKQTTKHRLMLPMQATLEFLITRLAAPIPIEVTQALFKIQATSSEQIIYQSQMDPFENKTVCKKVEFLMNQSKSYYRNWRGLAPNTPIPLIAQMYDSPTFFQHYFGVDSKWKIPGVGISKILKYIHR